MLNNFKNWIQNTAVAIVDDTASYRRTPTKSTGTSPTMLGNTLKLSTNLTQSTSSLSNINNKSKNNLRGSYSNGNCHNDSQSLSEIDLSNLSREEKEHIECVIKKAEEDLIMSENFLEMKRKSKANSQNGLNSKQLINGIFDTKNNLAPNNSNAKYSSSTSSLSSMSSCFSQNEHHTTSTPDEPNKTIRFTATDTATNNNLSNENLKYLEIEKGRRQSNQFQLNKPFLLDEMSTFKNNNGNNLESDNQLKTKAKRRLPSTPSFLNNKTDLTNSTNNSMNSATMTSLPDRNTLNDNKNVTEWLKKSFEQTKIQLINQNTTPISNTNNKQYRRNSASNVRVIIDEPLIEINLSRHYYKKQDSISSNNFISDSYQQYSKSQTFLTNEKSQMYIIDPNDDIKTVLIYKDPKELSHFKSNNEEMMSNSRRDIKVQTERRPSLSLGLQIVSKQISEVDRENEDKLGAIITSIEPDSVFDKFNVSINEGDEIVEICGVNLRNKSDSQIDEILDESCKKNNGEIELLVRRNHSLRKKTKESKNEPILPSSTQSQNSTDHNNNHKINNQNSRPLPIKINNIINNSANKTDYNNVYDASRGFNEISIKKKTIRPREQLIADPALLLNIKNKQRNEIQSRSFSPNINRPKIRLSPDQNDTLNQEKELTKNKNLSTNPASAFEMTKRSIQPLRSTNSPVALDDFRALRDTSKSNSQTNNRNKTSSDSNQDYDLKSLDHIQNHKHHDHEHDNLNRKYSDGSGYSNAGLSNSSSKDENVSVFSYNSNQKSTLQQLNHIQINNSKQDEKSSGYNSNQSTPTSEANSLKNQANSTNSSTAHTNNNKLEVVTLAKSKSKNSLLGEILIQLSHDDERNELIVRVLKARNLISKDSNGFSDPYCKLYLLPGRETENKRRTKTVFKSLNPIWNETFIYTNIYREEVFNKTLEFTLYDWDRFSRDDFLGILKLDLNDSTYLDNSPRWFALNELPTYVNTTIESDNTRAKRDFKSRLSFKRSKSLRRSS